MAARCTPTNSSTAAAPARAGGHAFERAYGAAVQVVNQDNYLEFVLGAV